MVVLGSGPNRVGQGIEFDYSCVHGVLAAKECGYETIMINCNPETVSTDPVVADKLYFEPVFWEHIYEIILQENPVGVIVQLGGQTALKLAEKLSKYGIKIIGTSFEALDLAEDRGLFSTLLKENNVPYPEFGTIHNTDEALELCKTIGFPLSKYSTNAASTNSLFSISNSMHLMLTFFHNTLSISILIRCFVIQRQPF